MNPKNTATQNWIYEYAKNLKPQLIDDEASEKMETQKEWESQNKERCQKHTATAFRENHLEYLHDFFVKKQANLMDQYIPINICHNNLLLGKMGSGKTTIALFSAFQSLREGKISGLTYLRFYDIFTRHYSDQRDFYKIPAPLILDDFLSIRTRSDLNTVLFEILDFRLCAGFPTTLVSFVRVEKFPDLLENRLCSRLTHFKEKRTQDLIKSHLNGERERE